MSLNATPSNRQTVLTPTAFNPTTGSKRKAAPQHARLDTPRGDSVLFGAQGAEHSEAHASEPTIGQRLTGALKAAGKSLTSGKFWLTHTAVAAAITLATCWLPGSQLITIPLYLAVVGAWHAGSAAVDGYKNPLSANKITPPSTLDRTELAPSDMEESDNEHSPVQEKPGYHPERLWGGVKGMGKQVAHDFKSNFIRNAVASCLITLATCWLPGSQLLTIPAWYCVDSAFSAVQGAYRGWKNPNYSPSSKAKQTVEHD